MNIDTTSAGGSNTARMDAEAFILLRSDELTSNMPDRVIQLCQLVDDIAGAVVSAGLAKHRQAQQLNGGGVLPAHRD